jgi:heterodisulfide reductase subunit C2
MGLLRKPLKDNAMKSARQAMVDQDLAAVRDMLQACIQCGTCTASCPNEFAMDATPRRLWRLVLMDRRDAVFSSKTFTLCSSCYTCTLRCPRGLPLTDAMAALKRIAARQGLKQYRTSTYFCQEFINSVRRHGRVREMAFMALYMARLKSPLLPLRLAPLGLKLIAKGKVPLQLPSRGQGKLEALFSKIEALERSAENGEKS